MTLLVYNKESNVLGSQGIFFFLGILNDDTQSIVRFLIFILYVTVVLSKHGNFSSVDLSSFYVYLIPVLCTNIHIIN